MVSNNEKQAPMANQLPEKYQQYRSIDPLPEIPVSLLNAYDIIKYVDMVGVVSPFERRRLKPASYELPFSGVVHWWDPDTLKPHTQEIKESGDSFHLEPNAIAFVYLATKLFLPKYIAVRFNLRITHVHQGLLLGTGPLVDPGFCGNLLVPLHNLTANRYSFNYDKGFIWVEFTKVSPLPSEDNEPPVPGGERRYGEFDESKLFLTEKQYFAKANHGRPIVSSVPAALDAVAKKADRAISLTSVLTVSVAVAVVAGALGIIGTVTSVSQTVQTSVKYVTEAGAENTKVRIEEVRRDVQDMRRELEKKYDLRIEAAERSIEALRQPPVSQKPASARPKSN
jgi:deoxycytidine triphosphate deaminase